MLKKLLVFAAFLGLAGLSANVYAQQPVGTNSLTDGDRNGYLEYVYNNDAVAHSTGVLVAYISGGGTYPGVTVSTIATANSPLVAGVVVGKALPASGWGYIKTHGYVEIQMQETCTAGDTIITSTTGEKGGIYTTLQSTGQVTGLNTSRAAVALETTTDGTCKAMLLR